MTIEVDLPNGGVGEFPDEMTPDAISAVLKKQFPPPKMETQPQFDAMGNPTGGTETVIARPDTTYAEQMLPIAKGIPSVGHALSSGATGGVSDQAIAAARAALGNAPDYQTALAQ